MRKRKAGPGESMSFDSSIGSGASSLLWDETFRADKRPETTEKRVLGSWKKEGNTPDGEVQLLWRSNMARGVFLLELWQPPACSTSLLAACCADHAEAHSCRLSRPWVC
jgi:hypothetical protein